MWVNQISCSALAVEATGAACEHTVSVYSWKLTVVVFTVKSGNFKSDIFDMWTPLQPYLQIYIFREKMILFFLVDD